MAFPTRTAAIAGLAAAVSLSAAPLAAAELPDNLVRPAQTGSAFLTDFSSSTYDAGADRADWRRCWRGRWGCRGWRGRGWRGRRGIDAGDVLAGVLVIGGIAAIASAASNNNRRQRERDVVVVERDRVRYDDRYDDRRRQPTRRDTNGRAGSSGLESAVEMCVSEIERDVRVDAVDNVRRTARGWNVTGSLFDGSGFSCSIGNDGRVDEIDYGGFVGSAADRGRTAPRAAPVLASDARNAGDNSNADGQWSDARYRAARAAMGGNGAGDGPLNAAGLMAGDGDAQRIAANDRPDAPLVPLTAERQPAYPGGPIPGEDIPETRPIDGDLDR